MIDIDVIIKLIQEYDVIDNVNKKKEILKLLITNFKECEKNISQRHDNLLKEERELNE